MSKELEALKNIHSLNKIFDIAVHQGNVIVDIRKDYGLVKSALKQKEKLEEAIRDLFANHIELVTLDNCCYFKIKNSKGKERSYTSKTFEDYWKEVFGI